MMSSVPWPAVIENFRAKNEVTVPLFISENGSTKRVTRQMYYSTITEPGPTAGSSKSSKDTLSDVESVDEDRHDRYD